MHPDRALDVLAQVASALDAAHEQHLIHRDLKPSNVLLATGRAADRTDHAYLADFGLMRSVAASGELTLTGSYLGTPGYSSPEQIAGRAIETRADVYALGCMLFEWVFTSARSAACRYEGGSATSTRTVVHDRSIVSPVANGSRW